MFFVQVNASAGSLMLPFHLGEYLDYKHWQRYEMTLSIEVPLNDARTCEAPWYWVLRQSVLEVLNSVYPLSESVKSHHPYHSSLNSIRLIIIKRFHTNSLVEQL